MANYKVRPDDTIVTIARKFKTTAENLVRLNPTKRFIYSAVSRYDFAPGSLRVGDLVVVPDTGAAAPARRRQAPRADARTLARVVAQRRRGLADEDCGDGQHLVDFGDYVACVSDLTGQPCGNGGTYNDYGECEGSDDGVINALQKILGMGGGQAAYNAYQAGQDGGGFANSLSDSARQQIKSICGYLNDLNAATGGAAGVLAVTGLPGAFYSFLTAACYAIRKIEEGDEQPDQPPPDQTYPQPCGAPDSGFYIMEPGGECLFAGAGDTCQQVEPDTGGFVYGTYDKQGACIPDAAKTAANKPEWLCEQYGGAPGSIVWLDPLHNVWHCLAPCGPNETLDKSDGMCACNAGFKRDAVGTCVKSSSAPPGGGGPPKTQPGKVPPSGIDNKPPVKPTTQKKESGNGLLYGGAALLAGLALWLGTRKKKSGS